MDRVLFSRKSDHWRTPKELYDFYMKRHYFDPCPYKSKFDGLKISWERWNFVNPPYSKLKEFVNKAIEEHKRGRDVTLLIPARTDTKYFRELVDYGVEICFITGRLHFNNSDSAPFPSCLVTLTGRMTKCYWRDREDGE